MNTDTTASIASHGRRCVRYFDELRLLLHDPDLQKHSGISYSAACDELGHFKIWAGNIGALEDGREQSSLEFRLKEAPRISDQVVELLQDLSESLEEGSSSVLRLYCKRARLTVLVCAIASGKRPNRFSVDSETREEYLVLDGVSRNKHTIFGALVPTIERSSAHFKPHPRQRPSSPQFQIPVSLSEVDNSKGNPKRSSSFNSISFGSHDVSSRASAGTMNNAVVEVNYTPTTHQISKAKKGQKAYVCEFPGCTRVRSLGPTLSRSC